MEIHQLRYLVALSQEKNFVRAARRVNITQPTLSQQVKKLEVELETPLFERSAHGVQLTRAGEKFLPYALATLDSLEKGIAEVREESGGLSGKISIGTLPTIGPYLLPDVLILLRKKAPRLRIELYEETTSVFVESLKAGKLDLGVISLPLPDASLVSRRLGREEFFLAASKEHPVSKRKEVTAKILKDEKLLILQEGHCFSDQALEFCQRLRNDAQIIFQGSSLTSVMKLAAVGEGLTLVPHMAASVRENPSLAFIPFSPPKPSREIGLVWRISAPLTRGHHLFMETVETVFNRLNVT